MKLTPASSAAWMMRIESSWSGLPQAPNIMAPRQSGLTRTPVLPRVRYSIPRPYPALVVEQLALHVQATGVAGELAGRADDAVARDDDADRVPRIGAAHRAGHAAQLAGQLAVGHGLAVRDLGQRFPDAPLELGARGREREVEALELAGEIGVELRRDGCERAIIGRRLGMQAMTARVEPRETVLAGL